MPYSQKSPGRRNPYVRVNRPFRWSPNKKALIQFIGAFRFLTDKECFPYWGADNERRIEKWLASLFDAGLIERVEVSLNEPIPHHLSPKGAKLTGFKVPRYIPHTVRDHELFIAFIGITLSKILEPCTYPKRPFRFFKPDAVLQVKGYTIFVEADCHSETEVQWRDKLDRYYLALKSPESQVDPKKARVCVVVGYRKGDEQNRARLKDLMDWTASYSEQTDRNFKNVFYFTTELELKLNHFQVPEFKEVLPIIPETL